MTTENTDRRDVSVWRRPPADHPVRVIIDFKTAEGAVAFMDDLLASGDEGWLGADLFAVDSLDEQTRSNVAGRYPFIVKRARDRIPGTALRDLIREAT